MDRKETKHPAYGMAGFRRVTTNRPPNLFGSSVRCEEMIELEIQPGCEIEEGFHHSYMGTGTPYIKVLFSPAQFADLLTKVNIGDGVPCTVERLDNRKVEEIPDDIHEHEIDRQKKKMEDEMKETVDELKRHQKRVDELLKQPRLNKEEKEELHNILNRGIAQLTCTVPFAMEMFQEGAASIVNEAKADIEAAVMHTVTRTGMEALGMKFENKTQEITD